MGRDAQTFGARIQTSPYGARKLIADAVDIALRLPCTDAGVQAGTTRVTHARHVAEATPVDAYEIPTRIREAVRLIHPGDVFPYAANTSRRMDLDHTTPYSEGGPTGVDNLGPMTRTHHRIKTHAGWQARQPFPGIIILRDPHGAHYLVDHTGTRRVSRRTGDDTPAG